MYGLAPPWFTLYVRSELVPFSYVITISEVNFNCKCRQYMLLNKLRNYSYLLSRILSVHISKQRILATPLNGSYAIKLKSTNMDTWRGVPMSDIYGSGSPWGAPEFPLVSPGYNHAVLYHISQGGSAMAGNKPPTPQRGQDKWDKDYVRMPCSDQSLYPVQQEDGSTQIVKRWDLIKAALQRPITDSKQLADAICSYNTKFKNIWTFRAMHYLFNEYLEEEESEYFFDVTLPAVARLALALPQLIPSPIPLLRQHRNRSISLTQEQISSLLANAFFCTFPRRNSTKKTCEYSSYPHINFNSLYESSTSPSVMEKLKCICHYFRRVCVKVPVGVVTFSRRSVEPARCPAWAQSTRPLGAVPLHVSSDGTIEDEGRGLIQVDFANKYLGGGVLSHGCVQEEIRFVICPELLVSMLFTQVLAPTEALLIIGCERFSRYSGYGSSFQWRENYTDSTPFDSSGRRRCAVLAIDALPVGRGTQHRPEVLRRELDKAWVGFSAFTPTDHVPLHRPGVATGNWGCGAFGGCPRLKSLLQLMACAEARRPVAYFTFGDVELRNDIAQMYNFLSQRNVTVGELYRYLVRFSRSGLTPSELYPFIHQLLLDGDPDPSDQHRNTTELEEETTIPSTKVSERTLSPDLFSSSEHSSQAEPFLDLEKGEGTLCSDRKAATCVIRTSNEVDITAHKIETSVEEDSGTGNMVDDVRNKNKSESKVTEDTDDKTDSKNDKNVSTRLTKSLFEDMSMIDDGAKMRFVAKKNPFVLDQIDSKVTEEKMELSTEDILEDGGVIEDPRTEDVRIEKDGTKKVAKKITDYFKRF